MSFEKDMKRLDEITVEMGKSDIPLEQSLALYQEAVTLIFACKKYLEQAKLTIEKLSIDHE